jgi:hypothetical protein
MTSGLGEALVRPSNPAERSEVESLPQRSAAMTDPANSPSLDARLTTLERQLVLWRRLALGALGVLGLAAVLGFQRPAPGPLEGSSLTLQGVRGGVVTLSLRPTGELEARFTQGPGSAASHTDAGALVIVSRQGREIVRLGEPSARQLAPSR